MLYFLLAQKVPKKQDFGKFHGITFLTQLPLLMKFSKVVKRGWEVLSILGFLKAGF
jgi:hypothetical protein